MLRGAPEWDDAPDTGVTTFNGRTGAVTPQSDDYTAEMVGGKAQYLDPIRGRCGRSTNHPNHQQQAAFL